MPAADTMRVVVIGAGQAAIQVAQQLRRRKFGGSITVLGDEGFAPYQRPPLSKAFLKGELDESRLAFKPESFFAEQEIDCRFADAAAAIDTAAREVSCADGSRVGYDRLVIATGAAPIRLPVPGAGLQNVFVLRGIDDANAIRACLADAAQLVVVGGGYIGLEVASAARQLGLEVTVVEQLPRLLSRVTSAPVSDFYLDLHRERGVDVCLEDSVAAIEGEHAVSGIRLASGASLACDAVVVGIGVAPNQDLAATAGIDCDDGVLVDARCRTSASAIYAAGDCARRVLDTGATLRLESVHSALVQGEQVAADIVGDAPPPFDPPWFWSDQFEVKLQTVGVFDDHDDVVLRGDPTSGKFAAVYLRANQLIAIDAVGDPASFMAGKQILKRGLQVGREAVADPDVALKDLVPRPAR